MTTQQLVKVYKPALMFTELGSLVNDCRTFKSIEVEFMIIGAGLQTEVYMGIKDSPLRIKVSQLDTVTLPNIVNLPELAEVEADKLIPDIKSADLKTIEKEYRENTFYIKALR